MNLAAGKAELAACPTVSEEAKAKLSEASAPPIRPVTIGTGNRAFKIGGETVMFRHEKRFENPPGIAILISDTMSDAEIDGRLEQIQYVCSTKGSGLTLAPGTGRYQGRFRRRRNRFAALVSQSQTEERCRHYPDELQIRTSWQPA